MRSTSTGMTATEPRGHDKIQVVVYGWLPGQNLELYETHNLGRAQQFARQWTKKGKAAFATLHVPGDGRVHLYARGRLSRRLSPPQT